MKKEVFNVKGNSEWKFLRKIIQSFYLHNKLNLENILDLATVNLENIFSSENGLVREKLENLRKPNIFVEKQDACECRRRNEIHQK